MPNNLSLVGGTAQKQTRFAPIFTSRFFSGLWTNRSPLRDATTSRIVEKYYGQAGDALMGGTNVEITTKLTLVRRPGIDNYDSHTYDTPDRFYEFKIFGPSTEQINVMIDDANALYSLYNGVRTTVLTKSSGAGQGYMQSVGNVLYYGDGVDNKKWLQSLFVWTASTVLDTSINPFFTTFFLDANGHILQLYGTAFPITGTTFNASTSTVQPTVTVTSSVALSTVLSVGDVITFPGIMVATYLEGQQSTVISISGTSMVVSYPLLSLVGAGTTTETVTGIAVNGGKPTTGSTQPVAAGGASINTGNGVSATTFELSVPGSANTGVILDGSAVWVIRLSNSSLLGSLENWGINNTKTAPILTSFQQFGSSTSYLTYDQFTSGNISGTTLIGTIFVIDSNGNLQTASSGTTAPDGEAPNWSRILGQTTTDGTVTWTLARLDIITLSNGGWGYAVALVNSLDNTVSNASNISAPTGNVQGTGGIILQPGAGLTTFGTTSSTSSVDNQADMVAIFRTTDGQSVPFLIPGISSTYTLSLADYLNFGYVDTTLDVDLNNLIEAPILGENTPPATGAINLTFHLGCIWYSIGNVVYWTSGPATPVGNGLNGTNPLNTDSMPSLVKRLVPVATGMLVFTVSDIFLIQGNNTASSPIQPALPILPGFGLLSYNALDTNGAIVGFFTTDNQFIVLDPSSGVTYVGLPIGDQLLLDNGTPGQNWNPSNVYVAWHVQGNDQGWYVCDGEFGWYRVMPTPSPEGPGWTWAPFATITGGAGAVQSIEITPGVHRLLVGPTGTGEISKRNLNVFTDNGTAYPANATVGSAVLTQPGQVATVAHIVTDAVAIGTPISLGILVDEALPYYTGPIDILKNWCTDPPNLPTSRSLYSQRFYMSQLEDTTAVMRHCQIQVIFNPADTVQNELITLTIFGAFNQEI